LTSTAERAFKEFFLPCISPLNPPLKLFTIFPLLSLSSELWFKKVLTGNIPHVRPRLDTSAHIDCARVTDFKLQHPILLYRPHASKHSSEKTRRFPPFFHFTCTQSLAVVHDFLIEGATKISRNLSPIHYNFRSFTILSIETDYNTFQTPLYHKS
jgi:hypothetical protein